MLKTSINNANRLKGRCICALLPENQLAIWTINSQNNHKSFAFADDLRVL